MAPKESLTPERAEDEYYRHLKEVQARLRALAKPLVEDHPVKPRMIRADDLYRGLFGEVNLESGAEKIVKLMQKDNVWREFTVEELPGDARYEIRCLIDYGWIVQLSGSLSSDYPFGLRPNERFALTKKFIDRCSKRKT